MVAPRINIPLEQIRDFCRKWKVREFSLFGSVLRDDFRPDSDVDVLVAFVKDSKISLWDWPAMQDELQDIFGGRKVDLVEKEGLRNPFRKHEILTTRQVVYVPGKEESGTAV